MLDMNLIDIIKSASNPPHDADVAKLSEYIRTNPKEVNQADQDGRTPCHHAVSNFPLLAILALDGRARCLKI